MISFLIMYLVDTVVTSTHANGYLAEVQSLVGMNAQEVNISFLEIYGRFDYMETIFQLINGLYNIEKENINFFSAESAIQKELQTNFKPRGSYAVLQILGTHSTVALYSKDILVGYTTAEFGWNTMQDNAIENGFALNVEAYESMVRTYTRGHLDEEHSQQMSELIENESREIDQVIEQLSFENQITKPKDMYVQSDRQIVKALIKNNNDSGSTRAILLQPNVSNVDRIDDENTPLLSSNVMIVKYLQDKLQDNIVV